MIFLYKPINSSIIQKLYLTLNNNIKECFEDTSDYHFSIFSFNNIFLCLVRDDTEEGIVEIKKKKYKITNFFVTSKENNNDIIIWDVCTPIKHRKQEYFKKSLLFFLKKYHSLFHSISLYVDPTKDNYINLIQMYSKFGFKITDFNSEDNPRYKLTLQKYPYLKNCFLDIQFIFELKNLLKNLQTFYHQYKEFQFQIDPNKVMTLTPCEILYYNHENIDTYKEQLYQYKNYIYIYPYYKKYFYNMHDFLFTISSNYFKSLFYNILKFSKKHSFKKIYSHVLNPHLKNNLTPRFYICIELKN